MKNMFKFSTITGGSMNFSSPDFAQASPFVCTTATMPGISTYQTVKP